MPTAESRALSIQSQFAVELMAQQIAKLSGQMMLGLGPNASKADIDRVATQYELLVLGAMSAAAQTRVGYLQSFAQANGEKPFKVPPGLLNPRPDDVLMSGLSPKGAVYSAVGRMDEWERAQEAQRELAVARQAKAAADEAAAAARANFEEQAARMARSRTDIPLRVPPRPPAQMAADLMSSYAESTVMSASDYVDRSVMRPDGRVVALRRVTHPGACDRCTTVAQILIYKFHPALRHDNCRCSFEPVFRTDPDYQAKLAKYRDNAGHVGVGRYSADTRSRGRSQLAEAADREKSSFYQYEWEAFLKDEQVRLAQLVKTVKSNTFRDWAVMTSANQAKGFAGMLPVITRD
jgi:hypothetical protein